MKFLRRGMAAMFLAFGSLGLVSLGQASATPSSIAATASFYAPRPAPTGQFAGQLAADQAGNLYIGDSENSCVIYKVDVANPTGAATPLANTAGSWCASGTAYGLAYAHLNGSDVLIYTSGSVFLIPLDNATAPVPVATGAGDANLAYEAATDTLVSYSFDRHLHVISSFSTCTTLAPCAATTSPVTGNSSVVGWGVAITGANVTVQADTALLGQVGLSGGAVSPFGPTDPGGGHFGRYLAISQDPSGNIFVMDPGGAIWEVPAGTTDVLPIEVTGPMGIGGYYAMVYSNGALYAFSNGGNGEFVKISFTPPSPPTTDTSTTTSGPSLARTGGGLVGPVGASFALLASGAVLLSTVRRRRRIAR